MNMHVATGAVILADKGLHLPLSEGRQAYFNYYWLRDNCPSSFESKTRERSFDIFHLSDAPRPDRSPGWCSTRRSCRTGADREEIRSIPWRSGPPPQGGCFSGTHRPADTSAADEGEFVR